MKLFFTPGVCSLAPHIVLREAGFDPALVRVDLATHRTADGTDFYSITAKGQVPLLELDDGSRLSEGSAISQYVADRVGNDLLPGIGDPRRYRVLEWQNYVGTELHKAFAPLFYPAFDDHAKQVARSVLRRRFEWVDAQLGKGGPYLLGDAFCIADAYLFTVASWTKRPGVGINLSDLGYLQATLRQIGERPAVRATLAAEAAA